MAGLLAVAIFAFGGCASFQCPTLRCPLRIDPTGERLFAPADAPPVGLYPTPPNIAPGAAPLIAAPGGAPTVATPGIAADANQPPALPPVAPGAVGALGPPMLAASFGRNWQPGLTLAPTQIVMPVGGEVVLVAGILGAKGYLLERERIEWMLNANDPGHFVQLGQNGLLDCLNHIRGLPKKVDATYAINTTSTRPVTLDRGTPTPVDDLTVHTGQAWVSISSPTEGVTHVTAYAPSVSEWDRRQQSATIYWIDAQWRFPTPVLSPVGGRATLTTQVMRQSDGSPAAGYVARYEIQGGPDAGFSPDGAPVAEVPLNEHGQASVEIFEKAPVAGSTQIGVQLIRPANSGAGGRRLTLGSGSAVATWTASQLTLRARGPAVGSVGATVTYQVEVSNGGGGPARDVVLTDAPGPGLALVNSNPVADASPGAAEWRLGEIPPGGTRLVEINYRVTQAGALQFCASAATADGLQARDCVTTNVSQGRVEVRVNGPSTAQVGGEAQFQIEVFNRDVGPAVGLVITDRFDAGLEHAKSASPIQSELPDVPPGNSQKVNVIFQVTRAGQLCHTVEVSSGQSVLATARACVTALDATQPGAPPPGAPESFAPPPGAGPSQPSGAPSVESSPSAAPQPPLSAGPSVGVRVTGPQQRRVGELAEFLIEVTNTGDRALENVRVSVNPETTLRPTGATQGFDTSPGALVWRYASLPPGESVRLSVNCDCVGVANLACNWATVTADGDISKAARACLEILPAEGAAGSGAAGAAAAGGGGPDLSSSAGAPPAMPEQPPVQSPTQPAIPPPAARTQGPLTLSVTDDVDPARVGAIITYRITLTNRASESDRQVLVRTIVPEQLSVDKIRGAQATRFQDTLRFAPINELRAGESVTFEILARAITPGSVRVSADVTSLRQANPVVANATTEILPAE